MSLNPTKLVAKANRHSFRALVTMVAIFAGLDSSCHSSPPREESAAPIARALAEPNWAPGITYQIGDLVQFQGIVWECRQVHTSAVGWEPPGTRSLWQRPTPTESGPTPWTDQTHYLVGSDVSFNGSVWESLIDHVSQPDWKPGMVPTVWRKGLSGPTACSNLPDGSLCDDGKACNVDTCQAGVCVGSAQTCGGSIVPTDVAVGTIGGSFGVSTSGTASYTVPLWAPEGRNGMTPNLALSYSSAAGDSFVGQGWSLSGGMSMVTRCAGNTVKDERPTPVKEGGRFCLDGQPLIQKFNPTGAVEFRTEPDTFTKIVPSDSDPQGFRVFTVYTPDGLIHTYGSASLSEQLFHVQGQAETWLADDTQRKDNTITQSPSPKVVRQAWLRRSVADRFRNTITFNYTNPGVTTGAHEPLLDTIEYVDTNGFKSRSIKFGYSPFSDPLAKGIFRILGLKYERTKVLTSIDMRVAPPGSMTVKTAKLYKLVQTPSVTTHKARLDSIQECDGSGTGAKCKNPTVFAYQPGAESLLEAPVPLTDVECPGTTTIQPTYAADIDHDGKSDLIFRAFVKGAPSTDPPHWFGRLSTSNANGISFAPPFDLKLQVNNEPGDPVIADFDSDGFPDIAVPSGPSTYAFYSNTRGGSVPFALMVADETGVANRGMQIGDFSGRGKVSILRPKGAGNAWTFGTFKTTCDPEFPCKVEQSNFSGALNITFEPEPLAGWSTFGVDIDGDRVPDILSRGGSLTNHLVSLTQQKVPGAMPAATDWGSTVPTTLLASQQGDLVKYLFLDQNGDGFMDAIRLRQGEAVPALIMNTGNGFAPPQPLTNLAGTVGNIALGPDTNSKDLTDVGARILDYDGDGKQDILLVDDGSKRDSQATTNAPTRFSMVVLVSRGTNFEVRPLDGTGGRPFVPVAPFADGPIPPDSPKVHNYRGTLVLDADGDGLPDILASPDPCHVDTWHREGNKADLLTTITDGMGKAIDVTYRPMTDKTVYTDIPQCRPKQGEPSAVACIYGNAPLVADYKVDNGAGGKNVYGYSYKGLVIDRFTRSPIGFSTWTVTDSATNTNTEETFEVDTPDRVLDTNGDVLFELFGHSGQPKKRVVKTTGTAADGSTFTRTTTQNLFYELVIAGGSYHVRSAGSKVEIDDSTDFSHPTFINYTPTYKEEWAEFGLTAGGETETCTERDLDFNCFQPTMDTWVADYDNFPDPASPNAQPWLIGLKTLEIRCNSLPTDATRATFGSCKLGKVPQRVTSFTNAPDTGAVATVDLQPDGPADQHLRIEYNRDETPFGLVTKITRSAPGDATIPPRVDKIGYDAQFVHAASHTNALNQTVTSKVDPALGVLLSITDPNSIVASYDYDTFGRIRRTNPPGGGGTTISYSRDATDPTLLVTKTIADGGGEFRSFVNRLGQGVRRESKNFDGTFSYVTNTFNELGLLDTLKRPAKVGTTTSAQTTLSYDSLGRLISSSRSEEAVDGNGAVVTSATITSLYTGRRDTVTDEVQRLTRFTSDEFGRPIKSEARNDDLLWVPTEYSYGHFGVLSMVIRRDGAGLPAAGRVTSFGYDDIGRQQSITDPDTGTRTRVYNAFGEVVEETDATLAKTKYILDALGRVTNKISDRDNGTTTFTWDTSDNGIGKLADTQSPMGVKRKFLYDTSGRLYRDTWTIAGSSYQVDYAFDPISGQTTKVTYPDAPGFGRLVVKNSYDPNTGRLSKVQKEGATQPYWTLSATEIDGAVKKEIFGNDVSTDYTLSPITGRLMAISTTKASTQLRSWGYAYRADGNLQRRSNLLPSALQHERFEYDNLDRIKRWVDADAQGKPLAGGWSVDYKIDDFGSITQRKFNAGSSTGGTSQTADYTIDPNNHRVTAVSLWTGSYSYDANGNQTGRPDGETVTYTALDLPRKITGPRAADFDYDAFGTRARKQKTGTSNLTIYVAGLYEKRVNGSTKEHVFYVVGPRGVVAQVIRPEGGQEDTKYVHSDNLGSIDTVTTSAGGIGEQTKRDPYGNAVNSFNQPTLPTSIVASNKKVRLGFTGHEQDDELGLINMRGRVFDPRLARFLTPDPLVGSGNGHNRYTYVRNNPLRFTDPTGFVPSCKDVPDDRECEVIEVDDPHSLPAGTMYQCDPPESGGKYTCLVTRPKPAPLPKPDPVVDPPSGSDGSGTGSGTGSSTGTGSGTGGQSTSPPPPGRRAPQDCTGNCREGLVNSHAAGEDGAGAPQTVIAIYPGAKADKSDVQIVADILDRAMQLDYRNEDGTEPVFQTQLRKVMESGKHINIVVSHTFKTSSTDSMGSWNNSAIGASSITIYFNPYEDEDMGAGVHTEAYSTLLHELAGHGYLLLYGIGLRREQHEQAATATENSYRASVGLPQRKFYDDSLWSECLPVVQW
jgi:RHS repeat-associated protein